MAPPREDPHSGQLRDGDSSGQSRPGEAHERELQLFDGRDYPYCTIREEVPSNLPPIHACAAQRAGRPHAQRDLEDPWRGARRQGHRGRQGRRDHAIPQRPLQR